MTSTQTYEEVLQTLSEASVRVHFDPFVDIAWDDPAYAIDRTDPRWVLPSVDPLGGHPWYQSLPLERQIEIGLWRQANVAKVGLQFENILIRGLMQYVFKQPNGSLEFRYLTHEATEECHHTQMFQEFVNRAGVSVPGMPLWLRAISPLIPVVLVAAPELFFAAVLAGEEPIDHTQKTILRAGDEGHPLLQRIMQIHIAEEARHISFAHEHLRTTVPTLGPLRRALLSLAVPVIMRIACDAIMVPSRQITTQMGVPRSVVRDLYWRHPDSKRKLREMFGDVRLVAEEARLMNPVSRRLWKVLGISGRPSRYRSQPRSLAA